MTSLAEEEDSHNIQLKNTIKNIPAHQQEQSTLYLSAQSRARYSQPHLYHRRCMAVCKLLCIIALCLLGIVLFSSGQSSESQQDKFQTIGSSADREDKNDQKKQISTQTSTSLKKKPVQKLQPLKDEVPDRIVKKNNYSLYEKATGIQLLTVPGFRCSLQNIKTWDLNLTETFITKNGLRLLKLPYPKLILLQHKNQSLPTYHYSELVTWLNQTQINGSIYVKSAPIYVILLLAASTSQNTSILVAYNHPDKSIILTAFVLNNIRDKVIFEEYSDFENNIKTAELIVVATSDDGLLKGNNKLKMLVVDQTVRKMSTNKLRKIVEKQQCQQVEVVEFMQMQLDRGVYLID